MPGTRTVAVAVAVTLALGGCASGAQGDWASRSTSAGGPTSSLPPGVAIFTPDQREAAPAIVGRTIGGVEWDLADHRGSVVVINAWASWCPPCLEEIPGLVTVARATAGLGVEFAGLNVTDRAERAQAVIDASGIDYPSVVDATGRILATIPGVPPQSLPSTIVVDRQGRIAARIIGRVTPDVLTPIVEYAAER